MSVSRFVFSALVVFSAAASLSLEVIWSRQLALVLGSATVAVACVLAAFMAGLAAGAHVGGRLASASTRPMVVWAMVQFAGAGLALLPSATPWVEPRLGFGLGLLAVGIATIPLGMLFPLAGRVRERDPSGGGGKLGRLYALDTGGALIGCLATGILAIPILGLGASLSLILLTKSVLGLVGLLLWSRQSGPESSEQAPPGRLKPAPWLLLLVAVQGFALLGAETLWSRLLAFVLYRGSSTFALSAMLACVLASQSAGAYVASLRLEGGRTALDQARNWAFACGISILFSLAILLVAGPVPSAGPVGAMDLLITILACAPASFFSGGVFATACKSMSASATGLLLAANALAALLGALIIPMVIVPWLGLSWSLAILAGLPILAALGNPRSSGSYKRLAWSVGLMLCGIGLALAGPAWTRHLGQALFYHEGSDVSVAVIEDPPGVRRLYVDGTAVAGTDLALATDQKTLAHLPLLLQGRAHSALTIGFGSGGTSHSMLLHQGLRVDCVELSQAVLRAAPFLTEANHGLLTRENPRYQIHLADGRRFLSTSHRSWDVIVNDCTDLAFRSDASLYTREFFSHMRDHLTREGIAAVWVPLRGEPPYRSLRSVVGSFADVFPYASLWVFDALPIHFGILVGSQSPLRIDLDQLEHKLAHSPVGADLDQVGLADGARLAASQQLDRAGLLRFAGPIARHTDDRPVVEFWAAMEGGGDVTAYDALRAAGPPGPPAPIEVGRPDHRRRLAQRLLVRPWTLSGHRAYLANDQDLARRQYLTALRLNPEDPAPRSLLGIGRQRQSELEKLLRTQPEDANTRATLGTLWLMCGNTSQALKQLNRAALLAPNSPGILLALGLAHLEAGQTSPAENALEQVLRRGGAPAIRSKARLGLFRARLSGVTGWLVGRLTWPTI